MFQQAFQELSGSHLFLFLLAIIAVCCFEFVNGFHDTANAVATVIYTRSLRPVYAVIWSGICNFIGVWRGGITVALGIMALLPISEMMMMTPAENLSLVFAILFAAIIWNFATWYMGIPCSSSNTSSGLV